ncbi:MAG: rpoE 4 [Acidobacteria bacterium]|jgi:RNA polymerase sigma-70 factor (ECF subfamily)|nr:rpoE 4 [Acidobacteriota bacterium]
MAHQEAVVSRFLNGDDDAFDLLVEQWDKKIYNLAWRFLGNREDAQDVVQETFLSVYKSIRTLREPRSFATWLYRIALNHCRSRWRKQGSDLSLDEAISTDSRDGEEGTRLQLIGESKRDLLEVVDIIQKALMGISEEHRTAILLKEYMGLSLEEVAGIMECPLSTAKSRLYHGLREAQRNLKRLGVR